MCILLYEIFRQTKTRLQSLAFSEKRKGDEWNGCNKQNSNRKRVNVRYLTVTAMLSAVAYILMFLDFSVPFMPSFIKMDLSELPALIGSFAMGPLCGVIICLVKMYFICSLHPQEELESFRILFWVWHLYCRQGFFISTKRQERPHWSVPLQEQWSWVLSALFQTTFWYIRSITISCHRRQCLEHISWLLRPWRVFYSV